MLRAFLPGMLVVSACVDSGTPLPPVHEDVERLQGVRFGLMAVELIELRPQGFFDDEGIYREDLDFETTVSYGFLPWVEGRRPGLRARLHGVEIRWEMDDTVRLWEAWEEAFRRADRGASGRRECRVGRSFRRHHRRATFFDSVRITLAADVVESADGQGYEAYLSTRMETPEMLEVAVERGGYDGLQAGSDRPAECPRRVPGTDGDQPASRGRADGSRAAGVVAGSVAGGQNGR